MFYYHLSISIPAWGLNITTLVHCIFSRWLQLCSQLRTQHFRLLIVANLPNLPGRRRQGKKSNDKLMKQHDSTLCIQIYLS